ncbi:hypothetical protein [Nonomuraea sp. NPDC049309]|jgi:hypothetical protein|uniref:hypothetical protein n=1 Tax=Nonomuraea sp. NPDC049309 TaxID=3364350 RepID=UPI0037132C83
MEQPGTGSRNVQAAAGEARGHVRCTPPAAAELFEIAVLDTSGGDPHWHTIGWGVDRSEADSIARSYVSRPLSPYEEARIRQNGHLVGVHRRQT